MAIPGVIPSVTGTFTYGETVVRLRAPLVPDPYTGENTRVDWDDEDNPPAELDIPGCLFDPGGSTEPSEVGRESVVTKPTVYAPFGADVLAGDRVVVRGRVWQINGDPAEWRNPFTGWEPGLVLNLMAVDG